MGYNLQPPSIGERLLQVREDKGSGTQLNRCLTLWPLIIQGIAHMLGAGIFVVTPSIVQNTAGPATCISYLISGFAAALSVLCYSDLAARYSCTGSAYVYTYFSIGELGAALVGFFLIGELLIQAPMLGVGVADNVNTFLFNGTVRDWQTVHFPTWLENMDMLAIGIMIVYMIINMIGIKSISYLNTAATIVSVIALLLFCVSALIYGDPKNLHLVVRPEDGRTGFAPFGFSGILSGAGISFFAFVGLESVVTLAEEAVNPKRDMPRATSISFLIVLILYVATAFSIAYFTPWFELSGTTGLIDSLKTKGLTVPQYLVTAGLIFTVFSCGLCTLTTVVRVVYSIAEDGLLFPFLCAVNSTTHVPLWNIVVCSLLGIASSIVYDFDTLSHMVSGGTLVVFLVTAVAVIILSYDLTNQMDETEKTPLTTERAVSQKTLFTVLMTLFLVCTLLLSLSVAFLTQIPSVIILDVIAGVLIFMSLFLIWYKIPMKQEELSNPYRFGKPFIQGGSVLVNTILLLFLEVKALKQLVVYLLIGGIVYFGYGMFFSKVTAKKQLKFERLSDSRSESSLSSQFSQEESSLSKFSID